MLHYMYNSGEKMTTKLASEITGRGGTFSRKTLKNLKSKGLLKWYGTSINDSTQYYKINF